MDRGASGEAPAIDVLLPAHNEAESISGTLREFHRVAAELHGISIRFVVSEDGSTDGTPEVLRQLGDELPIKLLSDPVRKGYSRAVVDGFAATSGDLVCVVDADGQCDPDDFPTLLQHIAENDLVVGYRSPRVDHWTRKWLSAGFKIVYRRLFPVRLRDPSCPYLIIRRPALERIQEGNLGILSQGFWWEFMARAVSERLRIEEVPVGHRARASGETQVYRPLALPAIAWSHLRGLFVLRGELKRRRESG